MVETVVLRERIRELLTEVVRGEDLLAGIADDTPLREAGVSSMTLINLLSRMEVEFGFEWDEDVDADQLRSIRVLADYVAREYPELVDV